MKPKCLQEVVRRGGTKKHYPVSALGLSRDQRTQT
jgi:hypothetical protein